MLTSRMKKTIRSILSCEDFTTLKKISDDLGVSTRTLLREIDDVASWVEAQGGFFVKKKGQGVFIEGDASERQRLLDLLNQTRGEIIYSPTERGVIIKAEMLLSDEPIKLFSLTGLLKVTESTVSNDINSIEPWFEDFGIKVIRRPGLGVLLDGKENAFRKAIVSLVYEQVPSIEILGHLRGKMSDASAMASIKSHINRSLYKLMDVEDFKTAADMLLWLEEEVGIHYADNAFLTLVIRIACTLKRLNHTDKLMLPEGSEVLIQRDKIYKALLQYCGQSNSNLNKLTSKECMLLAIHIKGSKQRNVNNEKSVSMIEDFKVIQLVKEFIHGMESETGLYLADNEALMFGLVKHLRPAIYRMKMDLDIINPLLNEIKEEYPRLFSAVDTCKHIIEEREGVVVSSEEVAYLATHIGAFIEKDEREHMKKYRVILACMYGIGASQLLVSSLKKNFPNVNLIRTMSIVDYKIKSLSLDDADLIISTDPIDDAALPVIVVNPILRDDDIETIDNFLMDYKPIASKSFEPQMSHYKDKFNKLARYNEVIRAILSEFAFLKGLPCKNLTEAIDYASRLIATNDKESVNLKKAFEAREERGSTILSKKGMILLHSRSDIKSGVTFKVLQFKSSIPIDNGNTTFMASTMAVMVAPRIYDEIVLDVLSEISRSIISTSFTDKIIEGNSTESEQMLGMVLNKYFEKKVTSL